MLSRDVLEPCDLLNFQGNTGIGLGVQKKILAEIQVVSTCSASVLATYKECSGLGHMSVNLSFKAS
jgi:hypothetical protein